MYKGLEYRQKECLNTVKVFKHISKKLYKLQEILINECFPLIDQIPDTKDISVRSFGDFMKFYVRQARALHELAVSEYRALKITVKSIKSTIKVLKLDEFQCSKLHQSRNADIQTLEKCMSESKNTAECTIDQAFGDLNRFLQKYSTLTIESMSPKKYVYKKIKPDSCSTTHSSQKKTIPRDTEHSIKLQSSFFKDAPAVSTSLLGNKTNKSLSITRNL